MTNAQKIRLRLSQVRQRLNEIAGVEGVRCPQWRYHFLC